MGKLLRAARRINKRTAAAVAVIAAAIIVPATLFAWGPDRPTFTEQNPASYVTFNSITNNSFYGDERNFTTIKDASNTSDGGWKDTVTAEPGKEYVVRMYVHNNAADRLKLVANNTRASASVPTTTGKNIPISGFVSADNANPGKIWDDVNLTSDKDFNLAYVAGSASFHNNSVGKAPAGAKLSDSIVTSTGALLGYDKLDGKIPGCYQYSGYVYFKIKPQFAANPNFTTSKLVSKHSENKWVDNYQGKPGETVDYLVNYRNTGDVQQDNVHVKDMLPQGVSYVPGSAILGNALNPNGIKTNDGVTTTGLNIGSYKPGGNAWVIFSGKVSENNDLPTCGNNLLRNVARVTASGAYKEDDANVTVPKECQPEVKYACDSLAVEKIERTKFKFTTVTSAENATFKKVVYVIRNEQGVEVDRKESTDKTLDYTRAIAGKYTVEALTTFTANGEDKTVTSSDCKKPFEVTELPPTPEYICDSLTVTKIDRTHFKFDTKYTVKNATFKSLEYIIRGENSTEIARTSEPTYTQTTAAKYSVEAIVKVTVNGEEKIAPGDCKKAFEVTKEECKPGIPVGDERCVEKPECKPGIPVGDERCVEKPECKPGIPMGDERCEEKPECKPGIPMNDARCEETPPVPTPPTTPTPPTPTELPKTGIGEGIAALVGAGSLIAAIGYYVASRRQIS